MLQMYIPTRGGRGRKEEGGGRRKKKKKRGEEEEGEDSAATFELQKLFPEQEIQHPARYGGTCL